MAAKQATSVALDPATRERIERARTKLSHGTIKPSLGEVIREAIDRGLPLLTADDLPPSTKAG